VIAVALVAGSAAPALADARATPPSDTCFWSADWEGWRSPAPDVILVKVGASQVFRLNLAGKFSELTWNDVRIVNRHQQGPWICTPFDLDLLLTSRDGLEEALPVKSFTRLTPAEIRALPRQDQP
jgi:hypothetical protein